jgi:dolichol-phosphate mannosyltransferase
MGTRPFWQGVTSRFGREDVLRPTTARGIGSTSRATARLKDHEWLRFTVVGASGIVVNQALLVAITEVFGVHYLVSATLATLGSSSWNFWWIDRWAFASRMTSSRRVDRFVGFLGLNLALLVLRIPLFWALTDVAGIDYATANLVTLVVFFLIRLAVSNRWLWHSLQPAAGAARPDTAPTAVASGQADVAAPRFSYDVAGLLAIDSDVALRELAYFRTERVRCPDIRIRVRLVSPRPTRRVVFEDTGDDLVYREHLGPLAANFALRMGEPIEIAVSPILAISPHVVYTNIVEALLRFLLVSKGYVLLHSAAICDEDGTTLLSAQTDTGKTSTVITLVRSGGYRFLSDDMTIIDPRGVAISYPKPMTLSFHTMGVAKDGRLSGWDRAALAFQSRLHSKSGRQVGRSLGDRNLPIMTMNSLVQAVVPPPKYRIDALFDCEVGGRAPIRSVVLMERGEERLERLPVNETVRRLIENTDDAYGFPPFSLFAPHIRISGLDYAALRDREAELLETAITGAHRWQLRVPGHEWAERLPAIIRAPARAPALVPVGPGISEPQPVPSLRSAVDGLPAVPGVAAGEANRVLVSSAADLRGDR